MAQRKADQDVEAVRTRRRRDQERMDSGRVTSPKDLERMQHELVSLDRRIGVLEDEELEIMEQLETTQAELARHTEELAAHDERIAVLESARDEKLARIDSELRVTVAERPATVEGLPEELLKLYDKLRAQYGVGAAELRARQCGGCRLTLDSAELSRIRTTPSDEVVRCDECSRILVRTAESGL